MKTKSLLAILLTSANVVFSATTTNDVTGNWQGTLDTGVAKLRLVFKISKAASGELTAKLDSIDQGARDIAVNSVAVSNTTLRMEVNLVKGLYVGTLNAAGTKAKGLWSQGAGVLPLDLEKGQGTNVVSEVEKLSPTDTAANKLAAQKLAGTWTGTLEAGASLRLRVNITKTSGDAAAGTMDSLDQNANGIPLSAITLKDGKVRFEVRGVGGTYEGTLAADGATVTGEWQQGGGTLPLEFKKASK